MLAPIWVMLCTMCLPSTRGPQWPAAHQPSACTQGSDPLLEQRLAVLLPMSAIMLLGDAIQMTSAGVAQVQCMSALFQLCPTGPLAALGQH